jgi:curved DNA-binding protein CbpA
MPGYKGGKDSLYDILEVNRSASAADIERSYKKLRAELEKDAAPPEKLTLVRQAHEVLSDPRQRAAYDASLKSDEFLRPEVAYRVRPAVKWVPIGLVLVPSSSACGSCSVPRPTSSASPRRSSPQPRLPWGACR